MAQLRYDRAFVSLKPLGNLDRRRHIKSLDTGLLFFTPLITGRPIDLVSPDRVLPVKTHLGIDLLGPLELIQIDLKLGESTGWLHFLLALKGHCYLLLRFFKVVVTPFLVLLLQLLWLRG